MPRLPIVVLLIALATAARAADRSAIEAHLMGLSPAAVTLGRTPADTAVQVVIGLSWRNRAALDRLVRDLASPQSAQFERFLTAREFERRFAPSAARVSAVTRFLNAAGLTVTQASRSRLLLTAVGRAERVERALATRLVDVLDQGRHHIVTATHPALPTELGAQVVAVGAGMALRPPQDDGRAAPDVPLVPAGVAHLYAFDDLYAAGVTGDASRASSVAIATAFAFDTGDLQRFWDATGSGRTSESVALIPVGDATGSADTAADRLETTLDVEWATAMAPGARVLVYAGSDSSAPTFLRVYDQIVTDNAAAVMTTSWGRCETDYPASYLDQVDAVFTRAAAQGITIVAASGDHGAFECAGQDTPSVSFPAAHPYVLAVGGTSLRADGDTLREVAWSASGGGLSSLYPAPAWQMTADAQRALADVAFNADPSSGYLVDSQGGWSTVGGTSAGAPIWAALIALVNQSRAAAGRASLGLAAPMLCEVGLASGLEPAPFVDITEGDNGAFAAGPGFDFPTGWGVPRAAALAHALSEWSPPLDGRGGTAQLVALTRTSSALDGAARVRFERRCLSTSLDLQVRRFSPGAYTLEVDGSPVASFSPDTRGAAMLTLRGVDPRGHVVSVATAGGQVLFSSASAEVPPPTPARDVHAELINTGVIPAARGSVDYHSADGRDQLSVLASGLPDGSYDVRLAGDVIGTLSVAGGRSGAAQFDSMGASGQPLHTSPLCKPLIIVRRGSAYLRSAADALSPGECGRGP
jgi:kumamolisin